MSLAKLFLSGLLIAGGLILGTFTLHGYFDPQWAQKQVQAVSAPERPREAKAIDRSEGRNRFVSSRNEQASPGIRPPAAATTAVAGPAGVVKAADTRTAAKPLPVKKKVAEKAKKPPPQQASIWPWNLFSSN